MNIVERLINYKKAIGKQKMHKPIHEQEWYYKCPICYYAVEVDLGDSLVMTRYNYCPRCGRELIGEELKTNNENLTTLVSVAKELPSVNFTVFLIAAPNDLHNGWYECGNCGGTVNPVINEGEEVYQVRYLYCPYCGVKIDWSEKG